MFTPYQMEYQRAPKTISDRHFVHIWAHQSSTIPVTIMNWNASIPHRIGSWIGRHRVLDALSGKFQDNVLAKGFLCLRWSEQKIEIFPHRYLIEFHETNRMSHEITPQTFHFFLFFQKKPLYKRVWWRHFLAKNAHTRLCLKDCNICLQYGRRVKVGLMSPWNIGKCPRK